MPRTPSRRGRTLDTAPTTATDPPRDPRRHDLDALRAFAMLLGIALHATLSFIELPWPVRDRTPVPELGFVVSAIHGFRMSVFFLLSGFFTAMLWQRRGLGGLLRHRGWRIGLPLLLGTVTIVPLMWVLVIWSSLSSASVFAGDAQNDLWTATAIGDLDATRGHVETGAAIDAEDPAYRVTPLGWAAIGDHADVVAYLLDAGADPSRAYGDGNTPLHAAAFFGRGDSAELLIDAGADVNVRNPQGETPLDVMRHDKGTTEFIAGLMRMPIDFAAVEAGRARIRTLLESRGAITGLDRPGGADGVMAQIVQGLMEFPFFHHLWFLWFLCWLVAGFALVVVVLRVLPSLPFPRALVASPLCLVWLVPLTMLVQSTMNRGGTMPGFGPDTSAGLLPMPHVLAYYAIFFGFGALVYTVPGAVDRLGRGWWLVLPMALVLMPFAMAFGLHLPLAEELVADETLRRHASDLGQVLFAWLMIFGLIGLFERLLSREHPRVRYLSDASYWLYLAHLPLLLVGQMLLRDVAWSPWIKLLLLLVVTTAVLLVSYRYLVRYTWLGRLLNGRRARPGTDDLVA